MKENVKTYQTTDQCHECKGECCRRMGCHFAPSDFKEIAFEYLKSKIDQGYISIDWWETDHGPEYYLRMRHVGAPVVDPSWGGQCIMLTDIGCTFSFDERPLGGKALRPRAGAGGHCETDYSKFDSKEDWKEYHSVLEALVDYYR